MKKYLWMFGYCLVSAYCIAFSQDQIVVHVSPGIAFGRAHTDPPTAGFDSDGAALRGNIGLVYDWNMKDNYYLSSGLAFSARQLGFKNPTIEERHEIQYLQVPLALKLYTSELALDLRVYAQIGFIAGLKINNRVTELTSKEGKKFVTKLRMWKIGALLSCGLEYELSLSTSIFAGISYQPVFSSIFAEQSNVTVPKLYGYPDLITLDIGVRF